MRAGCFAEDRVIDLINRRYVPFFFNRGGPGKGLDAEAFAFVDGQTENPWAYLAAFRPTGELLGETELYADKDQVAAFLAELLAKYPEYAAPTQAEAAVLGAVTSEAARLAAALLREQLADYDEATKTYQALAASSDEAVRAPALLGLLRITRYLKQWEQHAAHEAALREFATDPLKLDADMERGYRLLASQEYAAARELLQPLTVRARASERLAEAHFYAGVACWFLDDRDWAKLHWVWILEHLPEDRLASRARVAAAAEGMPYANPELGGYEAPVGNIGPVQIVAAVASATVIFGRLLSSYEARDFQAEPTWSPPSSAGNPASLVAELRDGDPYVSANNELIEQLCAVGEASIGPLVAALTDSEFAGRGYSGWALAKVMMATGERPDQAMKVLREAASGPDGYVRTLSSSGLNILLQSEREPAPSEATDEVSSSPFVLVAALRDGNESRLANNKLVEQLKALGEPALPSLVAAVDDEAFPGRGYAAWALGSVLASTGSRDEQALTALRSAANASGYVGVLARSGLSLLE